MSLRVSTRTRLPIPTQSSLCISRKSSKSRSFSSTSSSHLNSRINVINCRAPNRSFQLSSPTVVQKRAFHASRPTAKNPYDVLGVSKSATSADIKKSYFKLAKQYHPDTNKDPASKERFLEIQQAYEILSDDAKRSAYDTYGEASTQEGFNPHHAYSSSGNPFGGGFDFSGFGAGAGGNPFQGADLFSQLFGSAAGGGGFGGRARPSRGQDLEASVTVTFIEACKGTKKRVNITPVVECDPCSGSGLKKGAKRARCPTCKGSGTQRFVLNTGFQMETTCGTCGGAGSTVPRSSQCDSCGGIGRVKVRKQVEVDIPAGIDDGMTIRVPGAGDAAMTGGGESSSQQHNPGDLLVRVNVASSKIWRRQGQNLYHDARIPVHTAVLGGRVTVPTLDGETIVAVPPGTQPGQDVVLRGRGVTGVQQRASKGDLFVSFMVEIPRKLSDRQRKLFEAYADDVEGRTSTNTSTSGAGNASDSTSSQGPHKPAGAGGGAAAEEPAAEQQQQQQQQQQQTENSNGEGSGGSLWQKLKSFL